MFAFAGASTFPTIQADMADRSKFNISAIIAMGILFLIYFPMAVGCYYSLGSVVRPELLSHTTPRTALSLRLFVGLYPTMFTPSDAHQSNICFFLPHFLYIPNGPLFRSPEGP